MLPFKAKYRKSMFKTETYEFEVPEGYHDLSLGQYIEVLKWDGENLIDLVGILTSLPEEVIHNTDENQVGDSVSKYLNWITVPPTFIDKKAPDYIELEVPDKMAIQGKEYPIPQDIRLETFGQKISLQIHLKMAEKNELNIIEIIPMTLAIYLYPVVTGKLYDEDRARELIPLIKEVNLLDAYAVSSFFFAQFDEVINNEIKQIPNSDDPKQSQAGIQKLQPFGILSTVDALANGDMLKYDEVMLQRYCDVFAKLKFDYEKSEFQTRYNKVIRDTK